MRVRVELRRHLGRFIPRYRKTEGVRGVLLSRICEIEGRLVSMLYLSNVEPQQGFAPVATPELLAPTFIEFLDDSFRVGGFEVVDLRHHQQQWDIYPLPDLPAPRHLRR